METQEKSKLALTVYKPNGLSLREIDYLGQIMAASGRFADVGDKSKAIVQILAGQEMGFSPLVSMTKIYVIKGKISVSAELMASMIKRSGEYDYKVIDHTDKKCSVQFYRGSKEAYLSVFTIEDAKKAELVKSGSGWEKYPRAMLFSRALSQGARIECPHLLNGVYTSEEMGMQVNEEGEVVSIESIPEATAKEQDVNAVIALAAELKNKMQEDTKANLRKGIREGMTKKECADWKVSLEKIKADSNGHVEPDSEQQAGEAETDKAMPVNPDPKTDKILPAQQVAIQKLLEQIHDEAAKTEWMAKIETVKTRLEAANMIVQLNQAANSKNSKGDSAKQDFIDKANWFRAWFKQRDKEGEFLTVLGGNGCEKIEEVGIKERKAFLRVLEGMYEDISASEKKKKPQVGETLPF